MDNNIILDDFKKYILTLKKTNNLCINHNISYYDKNIGVNLCSECLINYYIRKEKLIFNELYSTNLNEQLKEILYYSYEYEI